MADRQPIRVLIADDLGLMREVMRMFLEAAADIDVIAVSPDLQEALKECRALEPDVIILNDYLPPIDSAHASHLFRQQGINSAILIVSMECQPALIRHSVENGANGFMHKEEMGDHLLEAVRAVHAGQNYLSPKAQAALEADKS